MSGPESRATVLVVDDEPDVADAYALRLEREYDVRTAYGGADALETIDEGVQVVLLDRRMPDVSGDEVLEAIRDRGYNCGVVMVTAVDPDFDIVDMPFDDYLQKPVDKELLFDTIDEQVDALDREAAVSELFSVTAKAGVLEQRKSADELESHPEYRQLKERARELRRQIQGAGGGDGLGDPATANGTEVGAATGGEAGTETGTADGEGSGEGATESRGVLGRIRGLFGV